MRKIEDKIGYEFIQFVYIISYYDQPLSGTCMYNNKLHYFQLSDIDDEHKTYYEIHEFNFFERIKFYFKQMMYELCVSDHYVYSNRILNIKKRKPKFIFDFLYKLYFIL